MIKTVKYHIVSAVLIFLFGGVLSVTVFCSNCLEEPYAFSRLFWIGFFYNGISWMAYWKGSEFLVDLWNKHLPWLKSPIRRFLASLLSIVVFVYVTIWVLDVFVDVVLHGITFKEALQESGASFTQVLMITLAMNVFLHGRGFLIGWRQAAIDNEKLKTEQVAIQYNSLKNQVNPHFLFNSFNALSSLVYEDQDKAVEFIRKLSQVYRYVLDRKDEEVVPVEEELSFASNFIFLQKIRFGNNLNIVIDNRNQTGFVPPLAIQLLVENAIKHNVVSEQYPLSINIELDNERCIVKNNIKEKRDKDSTGIGLNNLHERYKYLSDKGLVIENNGKVFSVELPILKMKK